MSEKSNDCLWIHELLCELKEVSTDGDRTALIERFRREHSGDMENAVIDDADTLAEMLITLKRSGTDHKLANLSEDELAELQETERIIDENLFDYYFQPIVSAKDGEIFSYEALMRPKSDMKLTPYQILKYASLVNRLPDIERGTFLNVLGIIDVRKEDFFGKSVFINSIPEAKMSTEDFRKVTKMLLKHSDTAVVEMTEQSEIDDESLEILKERYRNMGVKMAIDDYGSGYSNAGNLLRYMPNFVKIDRSLLTDIQNSPKKRHFVREIIHFCHENEILALAEGVETAEELHTVILLGADLIQGYFTARPAPEIIDSIPDDIKQMIKRYHQEREDGIGQQVYIADVSERIILERLVQSGMKCVMIGSNGSGDISVEGSSELDSQIRIETRKGYSGRITLENAWLNSIKNKPCIDIGEDNEVTLVLCGDNKLDMGGIRVPKSSKLTIAGEGRLEINVNGKEFYGIGNGAGLWHGDITFEQSGRITVNADGEKGVAIGSGNGGVININAGQYRLNVQGDVNVGIGALYAESDMVIHDCDIGMEMNSARGTAIGSIGKSDFITIFKTSLKIFMTGIELVGIGTLDGEKTEFAIREASCFITIKGERCSAIAALEGITDTSVDRAAFGLTVSGKQALGIGGFTRDTTIHHNSAEVHIKVDTPIDINDYIDRQRISIDKTSFDIMYNGKEFTL
ncbi:EAL domain-containing protein [uncultured Ruminococcus sp.]|uniref:EAL domain-containing protein n=1 Tax=uncultured Ruminococcus sp. TaxID=165186 RepID=UPI0025FE54AB|nr:EAL domain-containing protein [uncultured Ruminococcus sp.]